ncbi:glycoside hydrolase family 73 protein [Fructilactobacillus carniphilus]|uniref:Glucosaminidase domain-containing protein n=1 Tax=Fructilactobacillus carniphilus TaxID=2940297 RepID=A0ABY5BUM0_9LACO|nr:glucosaminidase domain-containing protein [Fructilactobacillus carniphilus]USS90202.1 glucosaminidase domain-containing protein [Fructilactobacillus carniphilus]
MKFLKLHMVLFSSLLLAGSVVNHPTVHADEQPATPQVQTDDFSDLAPNQRDFINQVRPGAIMAWKQYGVLPSVAIAQAIIESGWGSSSLAAQNHNLFGIKGAWNGQAVFLPTQEFSGGGYVTITDSFRSYPDWSTSIQDYGDFLRNNSRYANLIGVRDYVSVANALHEDGYATAPDYAQTLISCIQHNHLDRVDQEAFNAPDDYKGPVGSGASTNTTPNGTPGAANDPYSKGAPSDYTPAPNVDNSSAVGQYTGDDKDRDPQVVAFDPHGASNVPTEKADPNDATLGNPVTVTGDPYQPQTQKVDLKPVSQPQSDLPQGIMQNQSSNETKQVNSTAVGNKSNPQNAASSPNANPTTASDN